MRSEAQRAAAGAVLGAALLRLISRRRRQRTGQLQSQSQRLTF